MNARHPSRPGLSQKFSWVVVVLLAVISLATSEEWRPRHALVPPTGVLNLTEPGGPADVLLLGPEQPRAASAWRAEMKGWREERLRQMRYEGTEYERPDLAWTQKVYSQVQVLIWDRTFFDPDRNRYTVDRFLADVEGRLGPIDAVLIWPLYPNLGVDDRNQFDLIRDMPGGLVGLRRVVDEFHARGLRVFFPTLSWDTGTREETGPNATTLAQLMAQIDADGVNFDTLEGVPATFHQAAEATHHPLALEPQFAIRDESLAWSTISWNDWVTWEDTPYPFVPMVNQAKWLERRHTINVTDRFTRDKTNSLQHAFFNGVGYASLENLWGFWYGTTPHDTEAVLRFTRIERALGEMLESAEWEPYAETLQAGVFASQFPSQSGTLWTMVNRNEYGVSGDELRVPHVGGIHYYDLWHGTELTPDVVGGADRLHFSIEGLGFGSVLATREHGPSDLLAFMAERAKKPLSAYSRRWSYLPQTMVEIPRTKPAASPPPGMIRIPGGDFDFIVRGIEIEGGNDPGVDVQYPWEDAPRRFHRERLHMKTFYIDRVPVTNAEFKKFVDAAHYRPIDDHNFLRHWSNGMFPDGAANQPVTWISIEDARAYAAWAGKRLPHDWEWQYAAQGPDGRLYPWGNEWNQRALPPPDQGRVMRAPTDVDAFPAGASPFGVLDMTGNVSQWTDEFRDEHTRGTILRGGAFYQPRGSIWYFPQTYRLDEHQKFLLMSPGRDRAGTIGFRCVVDAP
ncbi:MAG TPA: SUMF1/EgtB/PvdO family nonheme iron enzyme [Candidatus Acidoferrales bacterium]|nr:SUMF1/EgtB/PvdO family nonheme iron enzyme [Candidatus Acidoferrales bacterium]